MELVTALDTITAGSMKYFTSPRSRLQTPWKMAAACVYFILLSPGLLLATARPEANPPLVLQYRETPIFLGPHEHSVTAIAFSPDGKTLATGANDGYLRL
jgi:WD40 repeat protein